MLRLLLPAVLLLTAAMSACSGPERVRFPKGGESEKCRWGGHQRILDRKNPEILTARFMKKRPYGAVEKAKLKGNILLNIRHKGCTRYSLTFEFHLPEVEKNRSETGYWYARAADLLGSLAYPESDPKGLKKLARSLREAGASGKLPYNEAVEAGAWQTVRLNIRPGSRRKGTRILIDYEFTR